MQPTSVCVFGTIEGPGGWHHIHCTKLASETPVPNPQYQQPVQFRMLDDTYDDNSDALGPDYDEGDTEGPNDDECPTELADAAAGAVPLPVPAEDHAEQWCFGGM